MQKQLLRKKIYQYTTFFDLNELGGYTVTIPSLPGLVTEGGDLQEARLAAMDAIVCYLQGLKKAKLPIPEEKESAQLRLSVKL